MCKILLIGKPDQDLDIKSLLTTENHIVIEVSNKKAAEEQILHNGYFDMVIARPYSSYEESINILRHIRSKSTEAYIMVILNNSYTNLKTWEWIKTLTEEVGIDLFIPENTSEMIKAGMTNAATRMKQRSLSPQFDKLANKILDKLS